jgi:uncharacterized phage protein (predicted DNA packaging)
MIVSLEEVKRHLNIEEEYTDEDIYLNDLIKASEDAIRVNLDVSSLDELTEEGCPPSVTHAVLLLIGNLYMNREPVIQGSVMKVPYTLDYLIAHYRNY